MLGASDSALIHSRASTVALIMTGVITLSVITRAFGNLPGEEQQEKDAHTAQWAEEPGQQTFLEAGLGNGEKEHAWAHRSFSLGSICRESGILKQQVGV